MTNFERLWFLDHAALDGLALLVTPVWIFDVDRNVMWWGNGSALKFLQAETLADLVARDYSNDSEIVATRLRQIVESTDPAERVQETWTIFPSDTPKTVDLSFQPIHIGPERRNAVLIEAAFPIAADGDAYALRILEAARNTPLLVSTFTLEGDLLVANPAALVCYENHGSDSKNALSRRLVDQATVTAILQRMKDNKTFQADGRVRTAVGIQTHRLTARRGRDPISGEVTIVLTEEDITERARLEQELATMNVELEDRVVRRTAEVQALLNAIPMPVSFQDREGRYVNCNQAFMDLLGATSRDMVLGQMPAALWPDATSNQIEVNGQALMGGGTVSPRPVEVLSPDGDVLEFVSSEAVFRDSGGESVGIVRIMMDMTDRKRAEERLRQAQRLEAVGQLTGGMAHDFNNLLTVVMGNLEMIGEFLEAGSTQSGFLSRAISAVERGSSLTQQMLAFARKQPLVPRSVDINKLVRDMAGLLQRTLGEDISIVETLAADLGHAEVDPAQLQNVIINLALNSRDAMPQGGTLEIATTRKTLTVAESDGGEDVLPGDYVLISVRDEGCGMSEEVVARAFEPYFTTKALHEGSGLGLSMIFGFVKQSRGHITLNSELGVGTEVKLFLPPVAAGEEASVDQSVKVDEDSACLERILVVEDDPQVRTFVTTVLARAGYKVFEAGDGKTALALLEEHSDLDLLFADVILPGGLSGRDVADIASKTHPDLRILFTSGYSKDAIIQDGRLAPGVKLLQKPYRSSELLKTLRTILDH